MDKLKVRKAADILSSLFDSDIVKKAGTYSKFFKSWEYFVGERCAPHSKILDIRNKILLIGVDHPSWIQLIQMNQHEILKKIKTNYKDLEINGISFTLVTDIPKNDESKEETTVIPRLEKKDEKKETICSLEHIKDDILKESLKRLQESIILKNDS